MITRHNNRMLRSRGGDWVKNGDRWHVTNVHRDGSLTAQHLRTHKSVRLPADYVEAWTELGYATTIHTAQGVTADTCHGLLTGTETRQQLYTMATRGRHANHLHIQVAGDGQPHPLDHDSLTDHSTIEILERILDHDEQAVSATTHARQAREPARLLGPAIAKYSDALGVAAEHHLGPEAVARLEDQADQLVLFLTSEPAWPTLKGHLVLLAAAGLDPVAVLRDAIGQGSIDDARDVAALLDWRIDPTRHLPPGPLPWLPGIPAQLAADPNMGRLPHRPRRPRRTPRRPSPHGRAVNLSGLDQHRTAPARGAGRRPQSLASSQRHSRPRPAAHRRHPQPLPPLRAGNIGSTGSSPTPAPPTSPRGGRNSASSDLTWSTTRSSPCSPAACATSPAWGWTPTTSSTPPSTTGRCPPKDSPQRSPSGSNDTNISPAAGHRRRMAIQDLAGHHPNRPATTATATAASASEPNPERKPEMAIHDAAEYLTLSEAAARYKVSQRTLRRRISTGDLPALHCGRRIIRIPATALDALFRPIPNARSLAS